MAFTRKEARDPLVSALLLGAIALILYAIFSAISYYWLFILINVALLYSTTVFLITYWETKDERPPVATRWPSVSVIIPSYNSGRTIRECLEAVKRLEYPKKFEIIIVDDASTDGSLEWLRTQKGITLLERKKNAGKAAALNQALAIAKGEIAACIDSDTFPAPDSLKLMVPYFESGKVGAVCGLVRVHKPHSILQHVQEIEYYVAFGFFHRSQAALDSMFVTPGPMSLYRRKLILELGGYEDGNITEDMEIALRLKNAGYSIVCSTDAHIYTEVPSSFGHWIRQRVRWYRGKIINGLRYKHMLFNFNFGHFGKFVFPFSFFIELMSIIAFSFIIYLNALNVSNSLSWLSVNMVPSVYFPTSPLAIQSSSYFLFLSLCLWAVIVYVSFGIAKERIRLSHLPKIAGFMFLYSFLISFAYLLSYVKELNRSSYQW
ncbi:MAG: glycosyltransferase [Candidatus Micrarchaeota archaeon]|nr:glycosyltransferase [Candidatus Micrarchaeota archaeon]